MPQRISKTNRRKAGFGEAMSDSHLARVRFMREVVDTDPDLKHREWLKSPGIMEAGLIPYATTYPDWYEDMKTGYVHGFLGYLDKKYPDTSPS